MVFSLRAGFLCFARGACLSLGIFFPWLVHSCQLARFSVPSRQSPLLSPLLCGRLWLLVVHRVLKRVSARVRALWTMPMPISDFLSSECFLNASQGKAGGCERSTLLNLDSFSLARSHAQRARIRAKQTINHSSSYSRPSSPSFPSFPSAPAQRLPLR